MQLHPRVVRSTIDFAARFEGLRRRAARLPGGGWTLGYGHSASAREGVEVDEADARALLAWDLSRAAAVIDACVFAPLGRNQFDALCDFSWNVGEASFRTSDVVRRLNGGDPLRAAAALELWRRAEVEGTSLVVDAVVRRRAAERALFLTPDDGFPAAPTPVLRPELDRRLSFDTDRLSASEETPVPAWAPLEGDDARPVLDAPGRSAVSAAADAVVQRLARIAPAADLTAPDLVATSPEPPPVAAPGSPTAPPDDAPPRAATPPAAPPSRAEAAADGPPPHDARTSRPTSSDRRAGWLETGVVWGAIGLIGLVLFAVAAVCILDRPTVGCLLVGLVGVLAMAPALLRMFGGVHAER